MGLDKREDRRGPKPWERLRNEYHMPLPPLGWKADTPPFRNEPRCAEGSRKHRHSGSESRCPQRPRTPPLHVPSSPRRYSECKSHSCSPRSDKQKDRTKSWSMSGSSIGSHSPSPKHQVGRHSSEHHELEYQERVMIAQPLLIPCQLLNCCKQGKALSPGLSLCLPIYSNDEAWPKGH